MLLALQAFQVLFLCLHDWVPLSPLNDVKAVRAANAGGKLFTTTVVSAAPFAFGLGASAYYANAPFPSWLVTWLWASYGLLFAGELRAWWFPYLVHAEPERVARYDAMFGKTVALLPERNGIRPNTLHLILHVATLATLIGLGTSHLSSR